MTRGRWELVDFVRPYGWSIVDVHRRNWHQAIPGQRRPSSYTHVGAGMEDVRVIRSGCHALNRLSVLS